MIPFGVPSRYIERYKEKDKNYTNLGEDIKEWKVPYWLTDAAFATMALQLLAIENQIETCFIGLSLLSDEVTEGSTGGRGTLPTVLPSDLISAHF